MPTQAELDQEQSRTKSRSGTIGKISLGSGVYDLNTTRTDDNKEGTDERVANDGIDRVGNQSTTASSGGGLPDGYEEELLDVVNNNNTAGQRYFLTKPV